MFLVLIERSYYKGKNEEKNKRVHREATKQIK